MDLAGRRAGATRRMLESQPAVHVVVTDTADPTKPSKPPTSEVNKWYLDS